IVCCPVSSGPRNFAGGVPSGQAAGPKDVIPRRSRLYLSTDRQWHPRYRYAMGNEKDRLPARPGRSSSAEIDAFLRKVAAAPAVHAAGSRGRLVFALDATASREPTWDRACHIQDRKSTRLNSSHVKSSYAVFCL